MKRKGFMVIELLIGMVIFLLVVGGAMNFLFSAVSIQRKSIAVEQQTREMSSLGEYMGRTLRQARKELNSSPSNNCLSTVGRGFNYELNVAQDRIRFLNRDDLCTQFFLSGTYIYEQKSTDNNAQNFGSAIALTSDNVKAEELRFALMGENQTDTIQPRVTFFLKIDGLSLQATISQRNFDVLL